LGQLRIDGCQEGRHDAALSWWPVAGGCAPPITAAIGFYGPSRHGLTVQKTV
jgi:hypothetical protein